MKVLVCGSRSWKRAPLIRERLALLPPGTVILHGGAHGADAMAGQIAADLGFEVKEFPANWDRYRGGAGIRRNLLMLDERPELVLAFWIDGTTGTGHTVKEARRRGIPVEVVSS